MPRVSAKTSRCLGARALIANLVLVFCSLAAGLLLCEIAVRLFAPQPIYGLAYDYAPRGYLINKSEGTTRFSIGGNSGIYHYVPPHLRGLRPPPRGAARILALGDSFTFGHGLAEKDTYIARLQERLDSIFGTDRIALLNGGIAGSGTAEHLAFLEDFGDEIAPVAVFVFVSVDDFNRAQRTGLYRLPRADTFDLDAQTVPISALRKAIISSELYNFANQHLQLLHLVRRAHIWLQSVGSAQADPITDSSAEQRRLVRAMFRRMKAWCDVRRIKLAVINNGWRTYEWLADLLASERIDAFDAAPQVLPVVLQDRASYIIASDGHPTAAGDALTADAVWPFVHSFVEQNNLAPKR